MEQAAADGFSEFRQEWENVISRVIARAWVDTEFKTALINDPTPILHSEGLVFPDRYAHHRPRHEGGTSFSDTPGTRRGISF